MMILVFMVLVGSQVTDYPLVYKSMGDIADPGTCDSAARLGLHFAAGCSQGVWFGAADDMRIRIPCQARDGVPNQVRILNSDGFIASTPCGLYLINVHGRIKRLSFPVTPGALDADGKGRAIVGSEEGVWLMWPHEDKRELVVTADDADDIPNHLQLAGNHVLITGERKWVIDLKSKLRRQLTDFGNSVLLSDGKLLTVDRQGRTSFTTQGCKTDNLFDLSLAPFEHVRRVIGFSAQMFLLTSSRWFLISGSQKILYGRLPLAVDPPIPVVEEKPGVAPWLIAGGMLMRPVRSKDYQVESCDPPSLGRLFQAAIREQSLEVPERPRCALSGWLPRVSLSFGGSSARYTSYQSRRSDDLTEAHSYRFGIRFMWDPDKAWLCPDLHKYELLRKEIMKQRQRIYDQLSGLLSAYQQSCQQKDWIEIEQIRAHIEVMTLKRSPDVS